MRRTLLFLSLFTLSAFLRADFLFWLDSPTGRNNPHDPKSPHPASDLPLAPMATPGATPTAVAGSLLVKLYDNAGNAVPGKWVQVNNNSAGAKQSNSLGQASFTGLSFPAAVHVFTGVTTMVGTISVLGVSGPTLEVWSVGGLGTPGVTVTTSVTHSFGSGDGYNFETFDAGGFQTGGQGSGSFGNPAIEPFPGQRPGDTANFMAYNYDSVAGVYTEAAFAPPVLIGASTTINLTLGASGWSAASIPMTVTDSLPATGSYYLQARAGASVHSFYELPSAGNYSMAGPTGTLGPILFPSPMGFCSLGLSKNTPGATVNYTQYVNVTSTGIPSSLNIVLPAPLQWTRSPTAVDPHVTVIDTDTVKPDVMEVYTDDWYITSLEPGLGQGIDLQFPTLPSAVSLTPFAHPAPHYAGASAWVCVSPVAQVAGNNVPYVVRGNYVNVVY